MTTVFEIIYLDPPWRFRVWHRDTGLGRSADSHYDTMTLKEIISVEPPCAENCAVFMWATLPMLPEAFEVLKAWGAAQKARGEKPIQYKTVAFVWVKLNKRWLDDFLAASAKLVRNVLVEERDGSLKDHFLKILERLFFMGMGYWTRANVEVCLLATRGDIKRANKGVRQLVLAPVTEHSAKPWQVRTRIVELMDGYHRSKLEMYARERPMGGWRTWGTESSEGAWRLR